LMPNQVDPRTLPELGKNGVDVSLVALRAPKHLNAIDADQTLVFQADDLTVVYGYNGADNRTHLPVPALGCGRPSWQCVPSSLN
jgi:hypothetical protein